MRSGGPYGRSYGRLPKAASCGWLSPVVPCSAFSQSLGVTLDTGSASCVSRRARVREYGHVVDRSALMRLLAVPDRRAEAIRAVAGGVTAAELRRERVDCVCAPVNGSSDLAPAVGCSSLQNA